MDQTLEFITGLFTCCVSAIAIEKSLWFDYKDQEYEEWGKWSGMEL